MRSLRNQFELVVERLRKSCEQLRLARISLMAGDSYLIEKFVKLINDRRDLLLEVGRVHCGSSASQRRKHECSNQISMRQCNSKSLKRTGRERV